MGVAPNRNIEVRVALLRNYLTLKDLEMLFRVDHKRMTDVFAIEMPNNIQDKLIQLINKVGSGEEATKEDADIFTEIHTFLISRAATLQNKVNEQTIAFVEALERREAERKKEDMDALSEQYGVKIMDIEKFKED